MWKIKKNVVVLNDTEDGPKSRKNAPKLLENFKARKIHPISKGLSVPTNPSITGTDTPVCLHDVIKGAVDLGGHVIFKLLYFL